MKKGKNYEEFDTKVTIDLDKEPNNNSIINPKNSSYDYPNIKVGQKNNFNQGSDLNSNIENNIPIDQQPGESNKINDNNNVQVNKEGEIIRASNYNTLDEPIRDTFVLLIFI